MRTDDLMKNGRRVESSYKYVHLRFVYICLPATYLIMMKNGNSSLFYLALLTFLLLWLGSASSFIPWLNKETKQKRDSITKPILPCEYKMKKKKEKQAKIHKGYQANTCIHVTQTTKRGKHRENNTDWS